MRLEDDRDVRPVAADAANSTSPGQRPEGWGDSQDILARLRLRATIARNGDERHAGPVIGGWRGALRTVVGPRAVVAVIVALGLVAVGVAGGLWWEGRAVAPRAESPTVGLTPVDADDDAAGDGGSGTGDGDGEAHDGEASGGAVEGKDLAPDASSPALVLVDVAGAVHRPGIVQLPEGSRVDDAVKAAGGAVDGADTRMVNLARPLADGEQIYIPLAGETPPIPISPPGGSSAGGGQSDGAAPASPASQGPINLNTADAGLLDSLPGIGPVLAERIVAHRDTNGPFVDVEQLADVSGIGPAIMERLRSLVTV